MNGVGDQESIVSAAPGTFLFHPGRGCIKLPFHFPCSGALTSWGPADPGGPAPLRADQFPKTLNSSLVRRCFPNANQPIQSPHPMTSSISAQLQVTTPCSNHLRAGTRQLRMPWSPRRLFRLANPNPAYPAYPRLFLPMETTFPFSFLLADPPWCFPARQAGLLRAIPKS